MNRLKMLRQQQGLKQKDLAAILQCVPSAISNYETGFRDLDSATICRLCEIFGCTADYLLGRSDLPNAELSEEEAALLLAYRRADDRARDIVQLALAPFQKDTDDRKAI